MKRFVCLFLSLLMVWSLCPVTLFAQTLNGDASGVTAEGEAPLTTVEAVSPTSEGEGTEVIPGTPEATPEPIPSVEPTTDRAIDPEVSVSAPTVVQETPTPSPLTEDDNLEEVGIKDLTDVAGSILKNTKYKDTFSKIADPINAYADVLGRLSQDAFNKELMEKIDKIQDTLETMETQIATENRRLETALSALSEKVDMQSYTAMMQEVKAIDGEVNYLYSDYKNLMISAETNSPEVTKANTADWARRAENLNIDGKIAKINAIMNSSQGTDSLLKAGRRVLTGGYPFEHQIHDPLYDMFLYTVGVRQRLLFLYSEYNHYKLAQKPENTYLEHQYVTRYNSVIESINAEVEVNQLDKIASPEGIRTTMELKNPSYSNINTVAGYRVILNANQKEYFMAQSPHPLSDLYDSKTEKISGRHDYRETFFQGKAYPAQDTTGLFKLIDSQEDLKPLAQKAYAVKGQRFLDYLVQSGGLSDLSRCKALLTSDHVDGIKGPLIYGTTETVEGRQNVYDANAIVYNELKTHVFQMGYLASALRLSGGYHFGGEAAETPWHSAPLLIILESGGDGSVEDQVFTPTTPEDFPGDDPSLGIPFGKQLTVDFSKMNGVDLGGKKLHLSGRVTLDGGDQPIDLKNMTLILEENAEVTIRNIHLTGAPDESVLQNPKGKATLIIKGRVNFDLGSGTKSMSGIKNGGTLTLKGEKGAAGGLSSLSLGRAKNAPGIVNGQDGRLTILDIDLSARADGPYAGIESGYELNIKGSKIHADAGRWGYCDIGKGEFSPIAGDYAIGTIESSYLDLRYSRIAGNIRVTSDCEYARNEAPYYITFVHGGDREKEMAPEGRSAVILMTVKGSTGTRDIKATCRPATFKNPETVVVEDGILGGKIGALEGVQFHTTQNSGLMPQSLKVAVGSPYGEGETLSRIDCYREAIKSPQDNPRNWFALKDRVVALNVEGDWSDTVDKGLQVAFKKDLTTQERGAEYIPLNQCPQKNDRYYVNTGTAEANPQGFWLKRTDSAADKGVRFSSYNFVFLKEFDGPSHGRGRRINQWMPLTNEPYFVSLDPDRVNSYEVSLALAQGSVPADDLIMEVEGQWATVQIPLKKHLPKGTTFTTTPVTFNVLADTGLGTIKRLRLIKEGDTGKTAMVIKELRFTFCDYAHFSSDAPFFTMTNTTLNWNEWKNLQASLAGEKPGTEPEIPKTETPVDQVINPALNPKFTTVTTTFGTSPKTGIPGTNSRTLLIFLALLGTGLLLGVALKQMKRRG